MKQHAQACRKREDRHDATNDDGRESNEKRATLILITIGQWRVDDMLHGRIVTGLFDQVEASCQRMALRTASTTASMASASGPL
jgi:hypothetical protein